MWAWLKWACRNWKWARRQIFGRPPSWICFPHFWTTHEAYWLVFTGMQNLVGMHAVVSMTWTFEYFARLAWKYIFTPPPKQWGTKSPNPLFLQHVDPSLIHPCCDRPHSPNDSSIGSRTFVQLWNKGPKFTPQHCPFPFDDNHPHLIYPSLDQPHSPPQTATGSNQPFCHSKLSGQTDRHTDTQTDKWYWRETCTKSDYALIESNELISRLLRVICEKATSR